MIFIAEVKTIQGSSSFGFSSVNELLVLFMGFLLLKCSCEVKKTCVVVDTSLERSFYVNKGIWNTS